MSGFINHMLIGYIDPGTGSMLLQIFLAGFAGVWVILKLFGKRILAFFKRTTKEDNENIS